MNEAVDFSAGKLKCHRFMSKVENYSGVNKMLHILQ